MLHHLLFIMILGSFHSLTSSAPAAADVKTAHAATHSPPTTTQLYLPSWIMNEDGIIPHPLRASLWLREHPSYVDAHISPELPWPLAHSYATYTSAPLVFNTLLDLHAHINVETLPRIIRNKAVADLFSVHPHPHTPDTLSALYLPTITKVIDLLLEQGSSIPSLQDLLTKNQAESNASSTPHNIYKHEIRFRERLFNDALAYLSLIEQAQRATAIRDALDPALPPPELQRIVVDYEVPA